MKGDEYNMKQGKCFIVCIVICSVIFCSCSKESANTKEKRNVTVQETNKEVKLLNDKIKKALSMKEYKMAKAQLALQLAKLKTKEMKY